LGENKDLPDKYFKEKTVRPKDIKNKPIADQEVVEKEEVVLEPLSMLAEKQEPIVEPVTMIMDYSVLINKEAIISCPVCHTPIPFNAQSLLAGVSFSCPSCFASVGLSQESKPIVEKAINKLEELKINK
jgi:hypothetical protein